MAWTTLREGNKTDTIANDVFVRVNEIQLVAVKKHEQLFVSIDASPTRGLFIIIKNGSQLSARNTDGNGYSFSKSY